MPYTPILATLGYAVREGSVLVVHRNARPDDAHYGKVNGLGGKLEPQETVLDCLVREFQEEAGITPTASVLRGTLSWPGFGKGGEDWFGFIFRIHAWEGTPATSNAEGTLDWVPVARLVAGDYPLWGGDRHFLPLVFDDDPRVFHGVMPYADGHPLSWSYQRL